MSPLLLLALLPAAAPVPPDPLADRVRAVIGRPEYRGGRWGVLVVEADSGRTVFEHNADQRFAPASVTKLYSCAAALVAFGADHRFTTPVYKRGDDLILVATGDPTLGGRTRKDGTMAFANDDHTYAGPESVTHAVTATNPLAGLEALAEGVKKAGIDRVTGDVLIDDRLFERSPGSGSGPRVISPIIVNDTVVDVLVRPGAKAGDPAAFELRPKTDFIRIDVNVTTAERDKPLNVRVEAIDGRTFVVRGQIPVGARPVVRICPAGDPAAFARAVFIDVLRSKGVAVRASALRQPRATLPESYRGMKPVATFTSPPLAEALKVTLKVSHNLYASTLPLLLAAKGGKKTLAEGMRRQAEVLHEQGVDTGSISLESGAGGGNGDRVTPRATVGLLQAMYKRKDWPAYEAMLPVLGEDGTLAKAVGPRSPARGQVKAKTGAYTDANLLHGRSYLRAKSLAGVLTTAKGKRLLFCIFVNDVLLPRGVTGQREGRVIGRLCEIIHETGP